MPIDTSPEAVERVAAKADKLSDMFDSFWPCHCFPHGGGEMAAHLMEAAALLRALVGEREWRPIETLPEGETALIFGLNNGEPAMMVGSWSWLLGEGRPNNVKWFDIANVYGSDWELDLTPIKWQPLPPPPATLQTETGGKR